MRSVHIYISGLINNAGEEKKQFSIVAVAHERRNIADAYKAGRKGLWKAVRGNSGYSVYFPERDLSATCPIGSLYGSVISTYQEY